MMTSTSGAGTGDPLGIGVDRCVGVATPLLGEALGDRSGDLLGGAAGIRRDHALDRVGVCEGDCSSTSTPSGSCTNSACSPCAPTTTGRPLASASAIATPNVSRVVGSTKTSASAECRRHLGGCDPSAQRHPVGDAQALCERFDLGAHRAVAHPDEPGVAPARDQLGECPHRDVGTLARNETADADEPQHVVVATDDEHPGHGHRIRHDDSRARAEHRGSSSASCEPTATTTSGFRSSRIVAGHAEPGGQWHGLGREQARPVLGVHPRGRQLEPTERQQRRRRHAVHEVVTRRSMPRSSRAAAATLNGFAGVIASDPSVQRRPSDVASGPPSARGAADRCTTCTS